MSKGTWSDSRKPWTPFDLWTDLMVDGLNRTGVVMDEAHRRGSMVMDQTDVAINEATRLGTGSLDVARQLSCDWFRAVRASTEFMGSMVGAARGRAPASDGKDQES